VTTDTKLEAAFARLEGVVTTEIKHLSHDLKNITQKLEAYPTHRDLKVVADRVDALEGKNRRLWNAGLSFAATVAASAVAAWLKFGG
jgi:hypothetical protein